MTSSAESVKRYIALLRPTAKFASYSHSQEFIDEAAQLGEGFYYVNLYDEQIDSNVIQSPQGLILIHNTYLSSFAYNLLLSWLWVKTKVQTDTQQTELTSQLGYHFKKYFAEQLYHTYNNIFSRAILLETLLYEQQQMVPVFEARTHDDQLDKLANLIADLMSSLVSFHELGHFMLRRAPDVWDELMTQNQEAVEPLFNQVRDQYPPLFVEEFKCDVIAVTSILSQYQSQASRLFCLKAIVFAYAAYAVLSSLTKSAKQTAREQKSILDEVNFSSIRKQHRDYDYVIGRDIDFIGRTNLVIQLCESMADHHEESLYSDSSELPLPDGIFADLLSYLDTIMVNQDQNARDMALLVAESLHGYPQGMQFLYLRSKTFSGRNDISFDAKGAPEK